MATDAMGLTGDKSKGQKKLHPRTTKPQAQQQQQKTSTGMSLRLKGGTEIKQMLLVDRVRYQSRATQTPARVQVHQHPQPTAKHLQCDQAFSRLMPSFKGA